MYGWVLIFSLFDPQRDHFKMAPYQAWEITGAKKRTERERQIPEMWRLPESMKTSESNVLNVPNNCGILTPEEISITSDYDALDIVQLTKTGKFSAEAITIAFCKRAAIAEQLVTYPTIGVTTVIC